MAPVYVPQEHVVKSTRDTVNLYYKLASFMVVEIIKLLKSDHGVNVNRMVLLVRLIYSDV